MNLTTIEWVQGPSISYYDSLGRLRYKRNPGFTWNPITGCLNGCEYCYARRLANTRLKGVYLSNDLVAPGCDPTDPFAPRFWHKRFKDLFTMKRSKPGEPFYYLPTPRHKLPPRGIFVCDMGELFAPWLPPHWTAQVLAAARANPQHRFYLLTKQPQRLFNWSPFPKNCWVGVSAWNHESFINACHYLQDIEATVKYISLEPLLNWLIGIKAGTFAETAGVSWLIIGAQTKPLVLPRLEWVESIVREARETAAIFLKESLRYAYPEADGSSPMFTYEEDLRQEFPV